MGIMDVLGIKGIFICDECRNNLKIEIKDEQFEDLKKKLNAEQETTHKCYLCNQLKHSDDGLKVSPDFMADAIEGTLKRSEKAFELFKQGTLTCDNCFKKITFKDKKIICPHCKVSINTKRYGKSIKIPMLRKIAFKGYIKFLRGK